MSAATYTRLTRGSMLDVMNEDYIRTARAKGLSERRVIFRHSLRAALTPIVTQFGLDVGILLGGAVITEVVFSMPGLGYTAVQSIYQQDLPVIIGVVLIASGAVVVANIVVDAFYAVLDPRVRLHWPIATGESRRTARLSLGQCSCAPLLKPSAVQPSRADCMGRNLAWVSASSAAGSESATMPPPANSRARVPSSSAQRRAMHHSPLPALSTQPTGPA